MNNKSFSQKKVILATAVIIELSGQSLCSSYAMAATIQVNNNDCILADAITAANTDNPFSGCNAGSGDDDIVLENKSLIELNSALPLITSNISIHGNGSTISGANTSTFRIFEIQNSGSLQLNETTVSGGVSPKTGFRDDYGSGIKVSFGTLHISDSTIENNTGVGIAIVDNSIATITNSIIQNNSGPTTYYSGSGGLHISGSQVKIIGSQITNNKNDSIAFGGAGLYLSNYHGPTYVNITSSSIDNNASYRNGGGISAITGGSGEDTINLTVVNTTISNNSSSENGGGINCNLINSEIINSTITNNTAHGIGDNPGKGGGIYCGISFPPAGAYINIKHSIVSGNDAEDGTEIFDMDSVFLNDYNLVGQSNIHGISGSLLPGATDVVASISIDGILAELKNNNLGNGHGLSHAVITGSPAIDLIPSHIDCELYDQNGLIRPIDGDGSYSEECDAGAVEYESDLIFKSRFE